MKLVAHSNENIVSYSFIFHKLHFFLKLELHIKHNMSCSALNCKNSSKKGVRQFRFPRDPERRKKWLLNCRRDGWTPGSGARICEVHFEENQFESNRQDGWKKLKPNAIPTIFNLPNPPKSITSKRIQEIGLPKVHHSDDCTLRDWKQYVKMKADRISNSLDCSDGNLPNEVLSPLEERLARFLGHTFEENNGNATPSSVRGVRKSRASSSSVKRKIEDEDEDVSDNSESLCKTEIQKIFDNYKKNHAKRKTSKKDDDENEDTFIKENEDRRMQARLVEAEEQKADALQRLASSFESIATSVEFLCHTLLQKK